MARGDYRLSPVNTPMQTAELVVSVCATLSYTGRMEHYQSPLSMSIPVHALAHYGPYFGATHAGSLDSARATLFPHTGCKALEGIMAIHVVESPMVLSARIMAAKGMPITPVPDVAPTTHPTPTSAPRSIAVAQRA